MPYQVKRECFSAAVFEEANCVSAREQLKKPIFWTFVACFVHHLLLQPLGDTRDLTSAALKNWTTTSKAQVEAPDVVLPWKCGTPFWISNQLKKTFGPHSFSSSQLHSLHGLSKLQMHSYQLSLPTSSGMEFREYLAIHAMCHRLLETQPALRQMWRDEFIKVNAADTVAWAGRRGGKKGVGKRKEIVCFT